jgi:hypothetical protein
MKTCPHKHAHALHFGLLLATFVFLCGMLYWVMRW